MGSSTTWLCGLTAAGAISLALLQGAGAPQVPSSSGAGVGPPELEPGKIVVLDWRGQGSETGEVKQVEGSWVKVRFTKSEESAGPEGTTNTVVTMAGFDAWVNFERLTTYRVMRKK
jgi:hypothetical protein